MVDEPSASPSKLQQLLEEMILYRNEICREFALTVDHKHCIGCTLVMDYMMKNFPQLPYGTEQQWIEETAFCQLHERDILAQFLKDRGIGS